MAYLLQVIPKTELANRLNDFSHDDEFVAESIDEGGFRSDTLFSGHLNPIIVESPICLCEFVKEFGQFKQEMMDLKSKVDIMAAEGMQ